MILVYFWNWLKGTGKSIVGAHLAYTFAMGNRKCGNHACVMYCGPSNKAVDVVHGKQYSLHIFRRRKQKNHPYALLEYTSIYYVITQRKLEP